TACKTSFTARAGATVSTKGRGWLRRRATDLSFSICSYETFEDRHYGRSRHCRRYFHSRTGDRLRTGDRDLPGRRSRSGLPRHAPFGADGSIGGDGRTAGHTPRGGFSGGLPPATHAAPR